MPEKIDNGLQKEEVVFQVDLEVKKEFLETQKQSTRKFYAYVLKQADEFEQEIGKSIYDLNIEDRDELLIVKYKNKTPGAFQSNLSPLRKYVDFCIYKKLVPSYENRFATILPDDYVNYINVQAMENSYIPKSEIREMQPQLKNSQDKLILELLSWGMRGRTKKGCTLEELVNLKVTDIIKSKKEIIATNNDGDKRHIKVDDYTLNLIDIVIFETFYYFNNGYKKKKNDEGIYDKTDRGFVINETEYVFRTPGKNKYGKVDYQLFTQRIQKMQVWLEKPYLTISNLYFSAMIDFAKDLREQKGELTNDDYEDINQIFQFGEKGQYLYKTKNLINMYI